MSTDAKYSLLYGALTAAWVFFLVTDSLNQAGWLAITFDVIMLGISSVFFAVNFGDWFSCE